MRCKYFIAFVAAAAMAFSCSEGKEDPVTPEDPQEQPEPETPEGPETPEDPEEPLVTIRTGEASDITSVTATLSGAFSGARTEVWDYGFYYGESASSLTGEYGLQSTTETDLNYTVTLTSLQAGTTYYYRAYITVWHPEKEMYVDFLGDICSFTTVEDDPEPEPTGLQYLTCYEIPAVSLVSERGYSATGTEADCNTPWFRYATTSSSQLVVTHTFSYGGRHYRNFTILMDETKKAPLWNAFVMHTDVYAEDNNAGRSNKWHADPAVPESWQSCFSSSGFSRGHMVASNYRQVCSEANKQTFYYTNQALQFQNSFNDGVWNSLEGAVKNNAPSGRDTLYVVVGLLYENDEKLSGVPLPSHFYKCLMRCSFDASGQMTEAKGAAYIFTNESHKGMSYAEGRTTIDAIEQRSGFDFFHNVPESLQEAAEQTASSLW